MRRILLILCILGSSLPAAEPERIAVEAQPLAANAKRLLEAFEFLGHPMPKDVAEKLSSASKAGDALAVQAALDPHVLLIVAINPESRVKVARGPAPALLQQAGYTPVLVKVVNLSTITKPLNVGSPQAGPVYAGVAEFSMQRQEQVWLSKNQNEKNETGRFLALEMFTQPPMTGQLSGLQVEYAIALIFSADAGQREATITFDVGQGTQDLGFRAETPVLFDIRPALPVKLRIRDDDGRPTAARLTFRDGAGRIVPSQPKRLAPDFFFQQQLYRDDGGTVLLPPGELDVQFSRGPEYRLQHRNITVKPNAELSLDLKRWVHPAAHGFYSGDHHIHGAGCAHYSKPSEGVTPQDMFLQVKGEGLNVGCVLTWGPCFEFQRQYFRPRTDAVSEPFTIVKYDLEISGFGSQALGHVCLLNLKDQEYPGSEGTKTKGWPTWTTPVMRWAKAQGGVTGYAHSASGLEIHPAHAAKRLLTQLDASKDAALDGAEAAAGLLPEAYETIDLDHDKRLNEKELLQSVERAADRLPNLAVPEMNGVGAMEICVSTALGACDFISAMDTPRIQEWNMWYHILNCGFPLKVSGETDFPCMASTRVGQGRVYVQLGKIERLDFGAWCEGLKRGRSYVSDGFAHALQFTVNGQAPGFDDVKLESAGSVRVKARVAFALRTPLSVAHGEEVAGVLPRIIGDTVLLHGSKPDTLLKGGTRRVEIIVNGEAVAAKEVEADGETHDLEFTVPLARSSWVALRHFPQLHTNPVNVIVSGQPIRASQASARWCQETIKQLWTARKNAISAGERGEAERAFNEAIEIYKKIADEAGR